MRVRLPYPMREPKFTTAWPPRPASVRLSLTLAGVVALVVALPVHAAGQAGRQETGSPMNAPSDRPETTGRNPEEMIKEGEICLENGDASRARDLFENALHLRPDDPRALVGLGRALTARRRYVEAEALYRDMENRHIEPLAARLGRARLRGLQGDHAGSRQFYKDVLQADPGNIPARLGLVSEAHALGLDRAALPQADNLVLDHPESVEARALLKQIRDDLAPRLEIEPLVRDDDGGNRVDTVTAAGAFMAEPQTEVRIALTGVRTRSNCGDGIDCQTQVAPPQSGGSVSTDSRVLTAGVSARLLRPLKFEARAGAAQEEALDGGRRTNLIGDALISWDVNPRLELQGRTGRRPLFDSAALVDWGIRVDSVTMLADYRPSPAWTITGQGDLGWYSDGNTRQTLAAGGWFHTPVAMLVFAAGLEARLRRFGDDRDFGYLDPSRYDSEIVTVRLSEGSRDNHFYWRVEGHAGHQSYDLNFSQRAPVADPETTVRGAAGLLGVTFGDRVHLEASYRRTNDALETAPGFRAACTGLYLRVRL
jgi:tetratricopeptide (TPR) repeat protein